MRTDTVVSHFGTKANISRALNISPAAVSQWGDFVPSNQWKNIVEASAGVIKMPASDEYLRGLIREAFLNETSLKGQLEEREGTSIPGSRCLINNRHFHQRQFRTVLNSMPEHLLLWARFCYGPRREGHIIAPYTHRVLEKFWRLHPKLSDSSIEVIKVLNTLAPLCVAAQIDTDTALFKAAGLRSITRHSADNWKKHWSKRWRDLRVLWFAVDKEVLDYVEQNFQED
ncbi:MAG: Cro/CI family transcriptional regulator [Rickettsiales bacterium]